MRYEKGEIIGHLKTIEYLGITTDGKHVWLCECLLCGMKTVMKESTISFSDNCGCKPILAPNGDDLTGRRFGKLTVLELVSKNKHGSHWLCRCDCGNTIVVYKGNLKRGATTSCGCSKVQQHVNVGDRFGLLTVIEDKGVKGRKHYWKCRCDCGNETIVRGDALTSKSTRSCGCLRTRGK